ncbi:MAG: hypothetical protein NTZ05_19575, partial [Chloroflexi bacterium]|nr:hypothetical protein [Chloroflexota bacterium]
MQIMPLSSYVYEQGFYRHVFFCEWPTLSLDFDLGEGQGFAWFTFDEALGHAEVTDTAKKDILLLRTTINPARS